jgi:hypothetical protein
MLSCTAVLTTTDMNTQTVIEGVTPPPAPQRTDAMVKAAVLAYIVRHNLDFGDADQAAADITGEYHDGMDGYELAKSLESNCGWGNLCLQDAEDLDSVSSVVRDAEEAARAAWVAEWDIQPPLPVGTRIQQGVIADVYEYAAARYAVKANGCTQDGRHLLVKFEDAQPIAQAAQA